MWTCNISLLCFILLYTFYVNLLPFYTLGPLAPLGQLPDADIPTHFLCKFAVFLYFAILVLYFLCLLAALLSFGALGTFKCTHLRGGKIYTYIYIYIYTYIHTEAAPAAVEAGPWTYIRRATKPPSNDGTMCSRAAKLNIRCWFSYIH